MRHTQLNQTLYLFPTNQKVFTAVTLFRKNVTFGVFGLWTHQKPFFGFFRPGDKNRNRGFDLERAHGFLMAPTVQKPDPETVFVDTRNEFRFPGLGFRKFLPLGFQIHPLVPIHGYWSRFRARALKQHNKIQKFALWAQKTGLSPSFCPSKTSKRHKKKILVEAKNKLFFVYSEMCTET